MSERLSHIARVAPLTVATDSRLLELARASGYDETVEPFFFRAEISNDLLDGHYTHMNEATLTNYTSDAKRGVAFLKGHDWRSLPIGYSVDAELVRGAQMRVLADFYTVPGMADTNDLIARIKSGLLRDVSVGFRGGTMRCDICKTELWDCRHYPGLKYEEKVNDVMTTKLATFTIEDAGLSEVSGVYDGSTPDAMILKAQRAALAGNLTAQQIEVLEMRYRVHLPSSKTFPVVEIEKESRMTDEQIEKVRASLGVASEEEIFTGVEGLKSRVTALEVEAQEGRQYRTDLVAEAIREGVRAQGNDFDATSYEAVLKSAPLATIKRMRDDWKKIADKVFPAGRASVDTEGEATKVVVDNTPDYAYRA